MITGADAWHTLPGHGQHVLRYLYPGDDLPA